MYSDWRLTYFKPIQDDPNDTGVVIEDHFDVQVNKSYNKTKGSFRFKVLGDNPLIGLVDYSGRVKLELSVNGGPFVTEMFGLVESFPVNEQNNQDRVEIKGSDASKPVLDGVVFIDPKSQGLRINEALKEALLNIKNYSNNFPFSWKSSNPMTRSDGSLFPVVDETWYYKPMREILDDYSSDEFTGDGAYEYYVDEDEEFVWKRVITSADQVVTPGFRAVSTRTKQDSSSVVNFVIVKMGVGPTGKAIEGYDIDLGSAGKHGLRLEVVTEKAKQVLTEHNASMKELGLQNSSKTVPDSSDLNSYNPTWDRDEVLNSSDEYVDSLINYGKNLAQNKAQTIINANSKGRIEYSLDFYSQDDIFERGKVIYLKGFDKFDDRSVRVVDKVVTGVIDSVDLAEVEASI